jgi:hypothetical protein
VVAYRRQLLLAVLGSGSVDGLFNDQECGEMFRLYGWAVFESAGLEEALVLLIAVSSCTSPHDRGTAVIRSLMDRCRKQTLGSILKEARSSLNLPTDLVDQFESALVKRNWLVHRFTGYSVTEMVHPIRRQALFQRLRELRDLFAELHQRAMDEMHDRLRQRGFSPEDIHRETEEYLVAINQSLVEPDE